MAEDIIKPVALQDFTQGYTANNSLTSTTEGLQPYSFDTRLETPTQADLSNFFGSNLGEQAQTESEPSILQQLYSFFTGYSGKDTVAPTGTSGFAAAAQGVGSLANAWLGFKNYGLAKDSYAFNKDLTETNLANQAQLINNTLASNYQARLNAGGGNSKYASLEDYMKANAVSGQIA